MAPISTLTVRLSAQIAEFQSEFRNATKSAEQFANSFEGIATRASAVGTFIGNIATKIASSLASAFGQGIRDAIRVSSEFSNAFIGLGSVARAFGTDANAATAAARQLSSDGLLPLKDSATGLKNLLATGFSLDQSIRLMNAFKDSAAFGRQGALSFGDAIRSATEGVKNGNSILVDNAGVTKNLSQILKEAGFSAQDLSRASSDAGVRLALFNGILKETVAQTGDAQRLTETYSGQVSRLGAAYDGLLATFGAAITQNATVARTLGAVSDALFGLNQQLVTNRNAFNIVSDGVIFLVRAFASLLSAVDLVQTGFAGLQIASNRLFEAFANIGIAIFKFTERAAQVQQYLDPANFRRHAAAAKEARDAYVFLEGAAQGLRDASRDAQNRSIALGNALQSVRASANTLARELEATRGKTVELGTSANVSGRALGDSIAGGAKKAADALKDLQKVIASAPGFKIGLPATIPGQKIPLENIIDFIPPDLPKILQKSISGFDGRINLPGVQLDIPVPPPPPKTWWEEFLTPATGDQGFKAAMQTAAQRAVGALADAIATGDWDEFKKRIADTISTFMADGIALAIDFVQPGLGQLLKPLIKTFTDKFVGLFDRNKGRDLVVAFADSFGGFDALQKRLEEMGAEGERLWKKLTQGVGRNNPEQAAAVIKEVEAALDAFGTEAERAQRRLDALGTAVQGVNDRAALFAAPFQKLTDAIKEAEGSELESLQQKLMATAQAGQAEFERLGQFAGAAFAGIVNETGDAIAALKQLEPTLKILQQGVNEFGLTSTATIDQLLGAFSLINDETFGPIIAAIQSTGQIFQGLSDAGYMTADLFQSVASDIGASFRDLEAKGGDVAKAMALSQPILQRLWEAQQIYGEVTDETTAKLLKQAEEQGLVGAHMKDVNRQILDVLVAIADVFGATIPDAIRMTTTAGQEAAQKLKRDFKDAAGGIQREFDGIRLKPLQVDIEYNDPGFRPQTVKVGVDGDFEGPRPIVALASGGIVRRPTMALVGEAGPEAVIPLSQMSEVAGGSSTVIFEVDGRTLAEATVPHIPDVVRRYGLV